MSSIKKAIERGAALLAGSMLEDILGEILNAFMIEHKASTKLLIGLNAPLGTLSARILASFSLGLIEENEYKEAELIRKIRNEFGHKWSDISFDDGKIKDFVKQLPWRRPKELEVESSERQRFNFAITILLGDLLWRKRLVKKEQLKVRSRPNKSDCVRY